MQKSRLPISLPLTFVCAGIMLELFIPQAAHAATMIDDALPIQTSEIKFEIDPNQNSFAVNDFITLNLNVGSSFAQDSISGEVRLSGPSCSAAAPRTRTWIQVAKRYRYAGRLTTDADARGCIADYCVLARNSSGERQETCKRVQLLKEKSWISLKPSLAESAVGQEVMFKWDTDRISALNGSVRFEGAGCALRGTSQSWATFFGATPAASGVILKEASTSLTNCSVRYCLSGKSTLDNSKIETCERVAYQPVEWRAQNWVRDGRYVYEPSLNKTSHITWAIRNDPLWLGTVFEVGIGTAPGRTDLIPWTPTTSESGVRFKTTINRFVIGQLYFASVRARDALGQGRLISGNGWRFIRNEDLPRTSPYSNEVPTWNNSSLMEVVDDDAVGIRTAEDIDRIRGILIRQLWPKEGRLPSAMPQEVRAEPNVYQALAPIIGEKGAPHQADAAELPKLLEGIADATGSLKRIVVRLPSGLESHALWFRPRGASVQRLAVVHQGHDDIAGTYGGGRSILFFLRNGFDVVSFFMPASGPNEASFRALMAQYRSVLPTPDGTRPYHNDLFELARRLPPQALGEHPVAAYLTPVRIALNYLNEQIQYRDITMIGCSGGGWTTTLYAALDPQIRYSFPVAGSLPLPLRRYRPVDYSDGEQHAADIYSVAGYRDLYVLGGSGDGRKQIQILNGNDDCCMRPTSRPASEDLTYVTPYTNIFERHLAQTSQAASDFGGSFDVKIDQPAIHTISNWSLWTVIAPVLGIEPKIRLTMNGRPGGKNGQSRTPIRGDANLRYEWSCENCTGDLRAAYSFGGSCTANPVGNVPIDWIKGPKGFQDVQGSPARIGCWINVNLATDGSPRRTMYGFDWLPPASVAPLPSPTFSFTMNGQEGSRDSRTRTRIRGDLDLVYEWSCKNCERPPQVTYSLGGSCGSGANIPIDWINTIEGRQFVRGSAARNGCWIDFKIRETVTGTEETVYYDWVSNP